MSDDGYITLKDGTKVPADDFWLYAPTWFIENAARNGVIEAIPNGEGDRTKAKRARG